MEGNRFLVQFMKMRQELNKAPIVNVPKETKTVETVKPVMEDDITYKKIIEEKPPKSDVIEYFRNRIQELVAEEDQ